MNQLPLAATQDPQTYSADYQQNYLLEQNVLANMLRWNWNAILIDLYVFVSVLHWCPVCELSHVSSDTNTICIVCEMNVYI